MRTDDSWEERSHARSRANDHHHARRTSRDAAPDRGGGRVCLDASIIIVEQNIRYSLPIADRAIVMKTGGVVYEGDPEPLTDHQTLIGFF